ncbi:MAG: hypothetical protein H0T76_05105 [Nannocystis sp.]|nr:hypothetical protein [Nannocystis sp.]MBA3545843.1 hypothetical protein [Nannocystis sp.]
MTPFRSILNSSVFAATVIATVIGSGCNFILNPENSDEVIRCKNTTECESESVFFPALNTERLDATCSAPGGAGNDFTSSKTNQVCSVVDKVGVSCDPAVFSKGPFYDAWERAMANAAAYTTCSADQLGTLGCAPTFNGACSGGLTVNDYGVCDDASGLPLYAGSDPDLFGQDVKDQHCRSYFCDDSFVCNAGNKCVRCDESKDAVGDLGKGACGDLAIQGKRSTVYQTAKQLKDACPEASDIDMTAFGPPVTFTPPP